MLNKRINISLSKKFNRDELPTANIIDIYQKLVPTAHIKHTGRAILVCCCFHQEDTASLALYPDTSSYYCFGCQKHGNLYNLVMEVLHCNFKESLKFIKENR